FFTLPMLLGNIFQQLYNMADSLIVGRIVGPNGLAAVGASFAISFLAIGLSQGASQGCSIIISQCFGAKDYKRMKSGFTTALIATISVGFLLSLTSGLFLRPLLELLQTPEDIFEQSLSYVQIVFSGSIFLFAYNSLTAIFNALGDSKTPLKFLIASTILNIILDILFVNNFHMGVNGAAIATLIAQVLSAVGLFLYFIVKIKKMDICQGKAPIFDWDILKNMTKIAIPSMIQQSMVSIGMLAVQGLVNSFGSDMVAGYTAASKIDSIAVMPILNIGIALSSY
ncbi:MAG: MATE family efflux transporter, partial [Oscillospiraceae bacterium]